MTLSLRYEKFIMCRFRIISNVDRGADWNVETQRAYAKLDFLLKKSNSKPMLLEGGNGHTPQARQAKLIVRKA